MIAACRAHYPEGATEDVRWERLDLDAPGVGSFSGRGLIIPDNRRIELVLPRHVDPDSYSWGIGGLVEDWDVWILVALDRLGAAHRSLRGLPVRLQPWWTQDGTVHFGRPETP